MTPRHINARDIHSLRPVLRAWTNLIVSMARGWAAENDCPWWYNERALVGTLAASVWMAGGQALEEYSNPKGRGRRRYQGRCDLYLYTPSEEFIAEAKIRWCDIGRTSREGVEGVREQLDLACAEARALKGYGERRLGMTFAVPRFPSSQRGQGQELLSHWQERLKKVPAAAIAWAFPVAAKDLRWKTHIYPGVAVIVREVGRS